MKQKSLFYITVLQHKLDKNSFSSLKVHYRKLYNPGSTGVFSP